MTRGHILILGAAFFAVAPPANGADVTITGSVRRAATESNVYAGAAVLVDGGTLTLEAHADYGQEAVYRFGNLVLTNGATVVCEGQDSEPYDALARGVRLAVATDLVVAADALIHADGQGFRPGKGPAAGAAGADGGSSRGGSHGGKAYRNAAEVYGDPVTPRTLGSGGGGGSGGGAIALQVAGLCRIDGVVSVDGQSQYKGSGAGGSLWITGGGILSGTGVLRARNGGPNSSQWRSGGGGGRLSIDDSVTYAFEGDLLCGRELSYWGGGAGTLYLPAAARGDFAVRAGQVFELGSYGEYAFGALLVQDGAILRLHGHSATNGGDQPCVLSADTLTIEAGGAITASGLGEPRLGGLAPGTKESAGGTHGGTGELNTASAYGSVEQPVTAGSAAFSAGGGALWLRVRDTLRVDGVISADGLNDYWSCGAGGSIRVEAYELAGTGSLSAAGGQSAGRRGGGGGRIALTTVVTTLPDVPEPGSYTNMASVSGTVRVHGGYSMAADGPEDGSLHVVRRAIGSVVELR